MRKAIAHLPLHRGRAPAWLFGRMKQLAREITLAIVDEFGAEEMLSRLSDPFWFQALGCVLGFDWHSSGVTTTVCAALKEGIRGLEDELSLFIAGGKGRHSRKTPEEIDAYCQHLSLEGEPLIYASRMSAKVDSAALQDGYQIYQHTFFFTSAGRWAVVQQGMNETTRYARRYHWLSDSVKTIVCEPHAAICCDARGLSLNLVAEESGAARVASSQAAREKPGKLIGEIKKLPELKLPSRELVSLEDINTRYLSRILLSTYEAQPENFEKLLGMRGVGPKTIRALSLIAELIYGAPTSTRDPARFSFAHGGKDGTPYPVDHDTYDQSIDFLRQSVHKAKLDLSEKRHALKRLQGFFQP